MYSVCGGVACTQWCGGVAVTCKKINEIQLFNSGLAIVV